MNTLRVLAATTAFALAAAGAASSAALSAAAGHAQAAHSGGIGRVDLGRAPADRSSLRDDSRSRFMGRTGDWGFAHAREDRPHGFEGWRRRDRRDDALGYPYGFGYPYGDDDGFEDGYAGPSEPGPFGPREPYGEGFDGRYAPAARPMASDLAPLAYGPGVHDGAYAYGYNGYAQTPPLFDGAWSIGRAGFSGGRPPCGC